MRSLLLSVPFSRLRISFALAFTFIFGTSVQRIWNAFIEVVVSRRFRVGDWVQFVGYSGFEVDYIDMLEVTGLDATGNRVSVPTFNLVSSLHFAAS